MTVSMLVGSHFADMPFCGLWTMAVCSHHSESEQEVCDEARDVESRPPVRSLHPCHALVENSATRWCSSRGNGVKLDTVLLFSLFSFWRGCGHMGTVSCGSDVSNHVKVMSAIIGRAELSCGSLREHKFAPTTHSSAHLSHILDPLSHSRFPPSPFSKRGCEAS